MSSSPSPREPRRVAGPAHRPAEEPLDWGHVNPASRIMVPLYFLAYTALGLFFLLQDPLRFSSAAFDAAKTVLPMRGWGVVFGAVALVEGYAIARARRRVYIRALVAGTSLAGFWAVAALVSALGSPLVSFTVATWLTIPAAAQMATAYQLASTAHTPAPHPDRAPRLWEDDRNPFQTFLLALALLSCLPLLAGETGSAVLERELDDRLVTAWGVFLGVGSLIALVTDYWPWRSVEALYKAMVVHRAGLQLVATAAGIYAVVVISQAGQFGDVRYAALVQVGFASACWWRARQVGHNLGLLRRIRPRRA